MAALKVTVSLSTPSNTAKASNRHSNTMAHDACDPDQVVSLPPPPPKMNESPLKKGPMTNSKDMNHLPTINFKRYYVRLQGGYVSYIFVSVPSICSFCQLPTAQ